MEKVASFKDTVKFVKLKDIVQGIRFRQDFGNMLELEKSIRDKGVIQPITLSHDMKLMAGQRRVKAAMEVGLTEIPALIRKIEGELDLREIELMENLARKDFTWQEEAKLVQEIDRLYRSKNTDWSQRKTAGLMNMGLGSVNRALQLAMAAEVIPEVAKAATPADALKLVAKLEEQTVVEELRKRQQTGNLDKGMKDMLRIASANYKIGDVFEELADLDDERMIDLIECDPPYGIDLNEQKRGKESVVSTVKSYNEVDRAAYPQFLAKLSKELFRVAGKNCWLIFWYGPTWHTEVKAALQEGGWAVDDIPAIWVKPTGQTNAPQFYLGRAYEPFFIGRKGKPFLRKQGRINVFQYANDSSKYHPTQRPLQLMEDVLGTFCVDLQTVLVPFLGSGVTLRAAYKMGMKGWGYDLNGEYKDKFLLAVEDDARHLNDSEEE